VTAFGGRNWTIFSASVLLIPTLGLAYFVSEPETPFWLMLLVASTAGLGGGLINLYQATPVAGVYLQNAGLMWLLPLIVAVFGAVFFMNNLTSAKSSFRDQLAIVKRK